jgi:hypothetical protein
MYWISIIISSRYNGTNRNCREMEPIEIMDCIARSSIELKSVTYRCTIEPIGMLLTIVFVLPSITETVFRITSCICTIILIKLKLTSSLIRLFSYSSTTYTFESGCWARRLLLLQLGLGAMLSISINFDISFHKTEQRLSKKLSFCLGQVACIFGDF